MSTYHVGPFYGEAEVWELMPSGTMAMRVATFTNMEDAQLFADTKNGIRREDVPELGPDEFVLVDGDGFLDESEFEEAGEGDFMLDAAELADPGEMYECHLTLGPGVRFFLTAHDPNPHALYSKMEDAAFFGPIAMDSEYCAAGTPTTQPLAPEHGDFL
jgi:hypothetical protein